eukprot:5787779-Pleurochrysis_carterae.AAC.3
MLRLQLRLHLVQAEHATMTWKAPSTVRYTQERSGEQFYLLAYIGRRDAVLRVLRLSASATTAAATMSAGAVVHAPARVAMATRELEIPRDRTRAQ